MKPTAYNIYSTLNAVSLAYHTFHQLRNVTKLVHPLPIIRFPAGTQAGKLVRCLVSVGISVKNARISTHFGLLSGIRGE